MTVRHEVEILRAIACGINAYDIQRMDPWTPAEVAEVMKRHNLGVSSGGTIACTDVPLNRVLDLARHSPHPYVQKQAARAHSQLVELGEALAAARAGDLADDLRRHHRQALSLWVEWLQQAMTDARGEQRRLRENSPRSKAQKGAV